MGWVLTLPFSCHLVLPELVFLGSREAINCDLTSPQPHALRQPSLPPRSAWSPGGRDTAGGAAPGATEFCTNPGLEQRGVVWLPRGTKLPQRHGEKRGRSRRDLPHKEKGSKRSFVVWLAWAPTSSFPARPSWAEHKGGPSQPASHCRDSSVLGWKSCLAADARDRLLSYLVGFSSDGLTVCIWGSLQSCPLGCRELRGYAAVSGPCSPVRDRRAVAPRQRVAKTTWLMGRGRDRSAVPSELMVVWKEPRKNNNIDGKNENTTRQ